MNIYISGALTGAPNVEELKQFYEAIAAVCEEMGIEAYLPHLHSDPAIHKDLTPEQVYNMDREQVQRANLLIAYVGLPSLGTGSELEMAHQSAIPIILLYEVDRPVSRLVRGNPLVFEQIAFESKEEALRKLREAFMDFARFWQAGAGEPVPWDNDLPDGECFKNL